MIPKVIHYCWFGHNEKPELVKRCIESWKKYCSDYEIKEWNEDNFDVNLCDFVRQAYDEGKWAFVSDVARIWSVLNEGGIYLDTDVELSSNNIEELANFSCWFAMEDMRYISTGLGFGAEKNNKVIKSLMDDYLSRKFNYQVCTYINTPVIQKSVPKFKRSKYSQVIDNIKIIGMYEYGYYARHHANLSWASEDIGVKKGIRRYRGKKERKQYFILEI